MRRTLSFATLVLACAAFAPACLLNAGALDSGGTGGESGTAGSGGTGGTAGVGGTGAVGGTGGMGTCGDGKVSKSTEQCDDGNAVADDGCTNCTIDAGYACVGVPSVCMKTCGNEFLDLGEQCDDGNTETEDGCNQGCLIDVGWECDNSMIPSKCHRSCGDGTLDVAAGEQCDTGDNINDPAYGCGNDCQTLMGWTCNQPDGDTMPSTCTVVCGDGIIIAGVEACDDANTADGDGCSKDCSVIEGGWTCMGAGVGSCGPACGDGAIVGNEECDDGNGKAGDGCSDACKPEHTCGDGIVDPTEECDPQPGATGCKPNCTFVEMSVCALAKLPKSDMTDAMTGVRTVVYEGDSSQTTLTSGDVAPPPCFGMFNFPVLHRYTTGKRPSILTIESRDVQDDNTGTFGNNVVWAYRDCPGKADLDGCDDDTGAGNRGKLTTGYIPALTTLYIALAGENGGGDKGPYHIRVTEQPVRLFYYQGFPNKPAPGLTDDLGDLVSSDNGGDGSQWRNCMPGAASGCDPVMASHSRGAFAFADDKSDNKLTSVLLQSNDIMVKPVVVTNLFMQLDLRSKDLPGVNEFVKLESSPDGMTWATLALYSGGALNIQDRRIFTPAVSDKIKLKFTYNDASGDVPPASIDDVYVYGY